MTYKIFFTLIIMSKKVKKNQTKLHSLKCLIQLELLKIY